MISTASPTSTARTVRRRSWVLPSVGVVALVCVALTTSYARAADPSPAPASSGTHWAGAPVTTTPMSDKAAAAVDALVASAREQNPDLPGLWIGVWDPDRGFYLRSYGDAATEGSVARITHHGRIGSVTKTFTTTAVLEQVAAGSLTLGSTIAQQLPDLAAKHPELGGITVEQLVGMRSGIADYANTGVVIKGVVTDPTKVWTADALIEAALTLPVAAPGTGGYSTTNTIILGQVLEQLTGQPIDAVVTDVARRAGLTDSALQPAGMDAMPDPFSHGYVNAPGVASLKQVGVDVPPGTDVTDWTTSWGQAGGGMFATIEDLGRWAATGLGTSLLPADLGTQRLVSQKIPEGSYGLGLFDWGNGWVGHTGQIIGWESMVAYNTRTGAAFVAIVNETGSLTTAEMVAINLFPDLVAMVG